MTKKGKVIVIEGVDGAGKTTQINFLKEILNKDDNLFLKEPGFTKVGQEIRKIILDNQLDAKTEIMLFCSARNELILNEILPAIEKGKNVIIDRFELSTWAYQIYGREREDLRDFLEKLSEKIIPKDLVDRYYFFDLDVEISKKREEKRCEDTTRFDGEGIEFFNNVRTGYKKEITNFPHKIIDASQSLKKVTKDFQEDILRFLKDEI